LAPHSLDFRSGDWPIINNALNLRLTAESPAVLIKSKEEFIAKVNDLVRIITEVLAKNLEVLKLSPFTRHWWTKELSDLKKSQNRLSNKAFKLHHLCDHPIHKNSRPPSTNSIK